MDKFNWVQELPTRPGDYWFCGQERRRDQQITMRLVKAEMMGSVIILNIANSNNLLYPSNFGQLWAFCPAIIPYMPDLKKILNESKASVSSSLNSNV